MNTHINPKIITWARERCGLSIDDLAGKMKKSSGEIAKWESGAKLPSYASLEKLAYTYLKVPLAIFYFPEPPQIDSPKKKLRRLPDEEFARLSSDTLYKIRLGQAYQESLIELLGPQKSTNIIFRDIDGRLYSAIELAKRVRRYLGITIEQQFAYGSAVKAFKAWRHAVETAGVFAFKDTFKDKYISGFCLLNDDYPVIFVNNSTAHTRQAFTLIHELGHILLGVNGVTDSDESYIEHMKPQDRSLETKCNQFAAEVLVPESAFQKEISSYRVKGVAAISEIANRYSVSREVILRRLLEYQEVTNEQYEELSALWNKEYLRSKDNGSGGDYYSTRMAYLGEGFLRLAFEKYRQGRINNVQLASHLNMNARSIGKLESYLRW